MNQKKPFDTPPEYRLRSSADYKVMSAGDLVLILSFPLKLVYINQFWKPVLDCFVSHEFSFLESIAEKCPEISSHQIEFFLNDLVRKGFFEQRGFPVVKDEELPFVSIIIPVRNRPKDISACLQSLEKLDYPPEKKEIIVIDDASDDNTPATVKNFSGVKLIGLEVHSQASFCRNCGAKAAKGDILAFIDSDCLAESSWLRELVPAFRDQSLGALGGLVDSYYEEKYLDQYEKVKSALKIGSWFKRSMDNERFFYVPTCNFLVRREIFLNLDGLKQELHVGEDVDFCWRLQDSGSILEYRPVGRVFHKHRNSPLPFCSRRFDYGTSEPLLQKIHPDRIKKLYLPPHESLFWMLLSLSLFFKSFMLLILCTGIFVSDTLNRYTKLQKRKLPISFLTICKAVIRSYLSFLYHCCSFVSRYYLIFAILLLPFVPKFAALIFCMHLTAGIAEYRIKEAEMNLFIFLFFFSLEQLSYQSGVWWGCIRHKNINPLLPRVVHTRDKI
ncbi:Putative mycofactocin biosynthesis glycosyltransferase [Desulfonema limicola]|uniref:Mycofactocin biosynthesis glycosyltransferase n=1 Tax=Desulfonema limicola TaxID=45656 RepID=A0A975B9V7_9BACT|nr:mycofactocin biosynthesis glycosyltransferase MftF [Desulfonema limicola]QTA81443.1 Putative mycofactocin biosynthesis glycosyltransferase [Desulfonema limicola]